METSSFTLVVVVITLFFFSGLYGLILPIAVYVVRPQAGSGSGGAGGRLTCSLYLWRASWRFLFQAALVFWPDTQKARHTGAAKVIQPSRRSALRPM